MRNQRSNNFIPVPTKPAKSNPRPLSKSSGVGLKKSTSSQTERVVLIKEENLSLVSSSRLAHNDGGMRRDYIKAINYINSCHKFINDIIEKNSSDKNKSSFLLPMVTNYLPLFPYLVGKKSSSKREKKEKEVEKKGSDHSSIVTKKGDAERKTKSNFAVKKVVEAEKAPDSSPVGDSGKIPCSPQQQEPNLYANQVADLVKEQISIFFSTLQNDMNKATEKSKGEFQQHKCKNLDIVKARLEELSQICHLKKDMENQALPPIPHQQILKPQHHTKIFTVTDDCSVILSDTDCDDWRTNAAEEIKVTCYSKTNSSLGSDSSDIKTDSDLELNLT